MKHMSKSIGVTAVWALMITLAQADPFIRPPEIYAPQWYTPFPYQRNINMGFGVSPVGAPGSGIPGAVYEGWLDPTLKVSDFVTLNGSVNWYASLAGITQTGLIGIDNRLGTQLLTGTAVFHIDNTPELNRFKNIWVETLALSNGGGAGAYLEVRDPLGAAATYLGGPGIMPYNGEFLSDYEFQIIPNPLYETIIWNFEAPVGSYIFLDGAHFATECIPEPAAFSLLALGALAALWRRGRATT
jgi:hypothetical protein